MDRRTDELVMEGMSVVKKLDTSVAIVETADLLARDFVYKVS